MAQYDVTHACGHQDSVNLLGKGDERRRRLEWLETQDCAVCRKRDEAKKVTQRAAEMKLSELTGSEKQIAWANKIRDEKMFDLRRNLDARIAAAPDADKARALVGRMIAAIGAQSEARWWIDRRDMGENDIMLIAGALAKAA